MRASPLDAIDAVAGVDGLTAGERLTLVMLARRWPNCHPGLERLARDTGASKTSVGRWIDGLEARGLVRAVYRLRDGRRLPRRSREGRGGLAGSDGLGGCKLDSTEYLLRLPGLPVPELPEGAEPWPSS